MAIDIRATVTCSLGTLISGSISDDYIQGSGLVKTRGSVEISGTITPAIGTAVTFSYTKDGVVRSIPRKLRVMSSFADPFRRTTTVVLGCKLTYLSDLKPAPTVNGDAEAETGKRRQCLNGYIDFDQNSQFGIPIIAADMANECLTKLGITSASAIPLTSIFYRDTFDLTSGYVNVLNDLLLSESYCGYLNETEQLVIFNLAEEGGTGPVFTSNDIIDISSIGVGDLPGDAVVVRYESVELKEDLENQDQDVIFQRNWTFDEVVGDVQTAIVRYAGTNTNLTSTYTYIPYTRTTSEYGTDNSWDDTTCVLIDTNGEGADLSNTVVKRTTVKNVLKAEVANDYCSQLLSAGFDPNASEQGEVTVTEVYEYDNEGQLTRQTTTTEEPFFSWAGRLNLIYIYDNANFVMPASPTVITSKTVVEITTLYADLPRFISLKPGETYKRLVNGQKTVTTQYINWGLTQQGEQGTAGIRDTSPFINLSELSSYLNSIKDKLVIQDTTIQTTQDRVLVGIERRPPIELRLGNQKGARGEYTTEILYVTGSPTSQRIVEFSIPYPPDDYRSSSGAVIKGTAKAVANRYGRVQNRLLLGNRNGVNLQLAPEKLPAAPYSPLYLQASGLTALYRANATNWAFDSNGIVCSVDALFWAAVGGTGTFWFPVAPGITTLPAEPPIVDGAMNANTVVLPYNETAIYDSRIRTTTTVTKFDYSLTLLTEVPATPIKTKTTVQLATIGGTGSFILAGQDAQLNRPLRALRADSGAFALTDQYVRFIPDRLYPADPGVFTLNLQPAAISYSGGDPYYSDVKLLLHMEGANNGQTFIDNGPLNLTPVLASAFTATDQFKFGSSSFKTVSTSDRLTYADNEAWNFGAGTFTVEAWTRFSNTSPYTIAGQRASATSGYAWEFFSNSGAVSFHISTNGTTVTQFNWTWGSDGGPTWPGVNVWVHLAVTRSGNNLLFFVNGTLVSTQAFNLTVFNSSSVLTIGNRGGVDNRAAGWMDELRITRAARYTASFTAPTKAFPDGPGTV